MMMIQRQLLPFPQNISDSSLHESFILVGTDVDDIIVFIALLAHDVGRFPFYIIILDICFVPADVSFTQQG